MKIEVVSLDEMLESGDADVDQFDLLATQVIIPNYSRMASLYSKIDPGSDYIITRRSDGSTKEERLKNNRKALKKLWYVEDLLRTKIENLKIEGDILLEKFMSYSHWKVREVMDDISSLDYRLASLKEEKERLDKEHEYLSFYYTEE